MSPLQRFRQFNSSLAQSLALAAIPLMLLGAGSARSQDTQPYAWTNPLGIPPVGAQRIRILTPTMIELTLISTKPKDVPVTTWTFAGAKIPEPGAFSVLINGTEIPVSVVGFKRRPSLMRFKQYDLRIGNHLYLMLRTPIPEGASVEVHSTAVSEVFSTNFYSEALHPAIHVNAVGYLPSMPKKAHVGYYIGSLGELAISSATFQIIDADSPTVRHSGTLVPRKDSGLPDSWKKQYQQVLEADFSEFREPGKYRLRVPGLGTSFPFRIDDGVAATFARTYALGLYHQRCGSENALPFTRFIHGKCHSAAASVPVPSSAFKFHQSVLKGLSSMRGSAPQSAPPLNQCESSLFPFNRTEPVDVAGGHHDAGDYSKYTINSAQLVHSLIFAADSLAGVVQLDNLGLPESGDGKSDILQIAKWEADFLARMQDSDGGFYFLVYPKKRKYEHDVLPDKGDPQVVYPKTSLVTAAATAALAQAASSPEFKRQFPEAAASYLAKAKAGWLFLQKALKTYGRKGAYQKIIHYGDKFQDADELAWAATEIFLATGDREAHQELLQNFNPASQNTRVWSWKRLWEGYGASCRSYVFGARSGRIQASRLDPGFLSKCTTEILAARDQQKNWARASAYGTNFPIQAKRWATAGWYFPVSDAFDVAVAEQLGSDREGMVALLGSLNFEAGSNPSNVAFLTGIGLKRQTEVVHQYALNDRRLLPPSGLPLGALQTGFWFLARYGKAPGGLTFPSDGDEEAPFAFYDRWADAFNVTTEFVAVNQARGLATLAWLMAATPQARQPWRAAPATISLSSSMPRIGTAVTAKLAVPGMDTSQAQIVWESAGNDPVFASEFTFTPSVTGSNWIEAEALWPDGRRAFAILDFSVK